MDKTPKMHTDTHLDEPVEAGQTLGSFIKAARKSKGIRLEDISKATGIALSKLQALEDGDRNKLPADVFVRGFIRIYLAQIGVDSQVALNMFEQEWGEERSNANELSLVHQGEVFAKSSVILRRWPSFVTIIVLGTIVYLASKFFFPALFVLPTQPIGEILSNELPEIEIITEPQSQPQSLPSPEETNLEMLEQDLSPKSLFEEQTRKPSSTEPVPETTKPAETDISAEPLENTDVSFANSVEEITHYTLHIQFTERTWIKISLDDQDPQEEIFKRGSEQTWNADKSIDLYLGNAGGVEISLNGKPMPLKQESGQTVRLQIP